MTDCGQVCSHGFNQESKYNSQDCKVINIEHQQILRSSLPRWSEPMTPEAPGVSPGKPSTCRRLKQLLGIVLTSWWQQETTLIHKTDVQMLPALQPLCWHRQTLRMIEYTDKWKTNQYLENGCSTVLILSASNQTGDCLEMRRTWSVLHQTGCFPEEIPCWLSDRENNSTDIHHLAIFYESSSGGGSAASSGPLHSDASSAALLHLLCLSPAGGAARSPGWIHQGSDHHRRGQVSSDSPAFSRRALF